MLLLVCMVSKAEPDATLLRGLYWFSALLLINWILEFWAVQYRNPVKLTIRR